MASVMACALKPEKLYAQNPSNQRESAPSSWTLTFHLLLWADFTLHQHSNK